MQMFSKKEEKNSSTVPKGRHLSFFKEQKD
jgi:hypothetical protein